MDVRTGEVMTVAKMMEKIREEGKPEAFVQLKQKAKPSCRHCYGRGWEFTTQNGAGETVHVPCRCTLK